MKTIIKTLPTTGAITLDEAKTQLGYDLTYTDRDPEFNSNILSVTASLDKLTGKRTITQTIELLFDTWEELKEHVVKQGKIVSMTLAYLDEDRVSQDVTDFTAVGIKSEEGRVVFDSGFLFPDIWGIESIILSVIVGEEIAKVTEDKKTILKLMISELMEDADVSKIVERYVTNNKYWSC